MRFKCSSYEKKMDVPPLSTYKQRRPTSFNFSIKHFASFCNKYLYHVVFIINEKLQWLPQRFLTNFLGESSSNEVRCVYVQFYFLFLSLYICLSVALLFLYFNIAFLTLNQECFFKISACTFNHQSSRTGQKIHHKKLKFLLNVAKN